MEKWLGGAISGIILNSLHYLMPKRDTKNIVQTLTITNSHSTKIKKSSLVQSLCKNAGWPQKIVVVVVVVFTEMHLLGVILYKGRLKRTLLELK